MASGLGPNPDPGRGEDDGNAPGPEDQPRAGRAQYGAGRNAADGDGSATASGEHVPQNGVAGIRIKVWIKIIPYNRKTLGTNKTPDNYTGLRSNQR